MGRDILKFVVFIFIFISAYQAFDTFRSAIKGIQPKTSAPDKNPEAFSTRAWGFGWGLIMSFICLVCIWIVVAA
jgi:hypothetical protein